MRKISILLYIGVLLICSSCTSKDTENTPSEDYKVAYEEYSEERVELNDFERVTVDDEHILTNIYYSDISGYVVPVLRTIPKQDGLAKSTLTALIDNNENRLDLMDLGLIPVLPDGTTFELALKDDNVIWVDFNDKILEFKSEKQEKSAVQSVVYTLTEFDTVKEVQILVNNEIMDKLTYGTDISKPLNRNNINSLDNYISGESVKKTFYSYKNITDKYTYFIPITKNLPRGQDDIEAILQEEINLNKELGVSIASDFNVKKVIVENNIAYITIDKKFDSNEEFTNFMKVISLTLSQNETIESIKLIVENSEVEDMQITTFSIPQYANVY